MFRKEKENKLKLVLNFHLKGIKKTIRRMRRFG